MLKKILAFVMVVAVVAGGVLAYAFFRPPEKASAPIQAIPLGTPKISSPTTPAVALVQGDQTFTPTPVEDALTTEQDAAPAMTPSAAAEIAQTPIPTESAEAPMDPSIFSIVPERSEVRFIIDEVLRGADNTVVGATDQIAGEFAVDSTNPSQSRVGTILVNARTLVTDNDFRNRAIKNQILDTNQFEFVTFVPTQLQGLPENAIIGERYDFQITGDLTIRDVTRPVTFAVSVSPLSETDVEGTASAQISRGDFGLTIPSVRSVSFVSDEVTLEIDFVATGG
jgi:polyisoprenoid-binding protein YceI